MSAEVLLEQQIEKLAALCELAICLLRNRDERGGPDFAVDEIEANYRAALKGPK